MSISKYSVSLSLKFQYLCWSELAVYNHQMVKGKQIVLLIAIIAVVSCENWQIAGPTPAPTTADSIVCLNLALGDTIYVELSSVTNTLSTGTQAMVRGSLLFGGVVVNQTTFSSPGSGSLVFTVSGASQVGFYDFFIEQKGLFFTNYTLEVLINGTIVLTKNALSGDGLNMRKVGRFFQPAYSANYRFTPAADAGKTFCFIRTDEYASTVYGYICMNIPSAINPPSFTLFPNQLFFFQTFDLTAPDYFSYSSSLAASPFIIEWDIDTIMCLNVGDHFVQELNQCCPEWQGYVASYNYCKCAAGTILNFEGDACFQCQSDRYTSSAEYLSINQCICNDPGEALYIPQLSRCCPSNSGFHAGFQNCECDDGYTWDSNHYWCVECAVDTWTTGAGTGIPNECACVTDAYFVDGLGTCCPNNAVYVDDGSEECQCHLPFAWSQDGTACVSLIQCVEDARTLAIATPEGGCQCKKDKFVWSQQDFSCIPEKRYQAQYLKKEATAEEEEEEEDIFEAP